MGPAFVDSGVPICGGCPWHRRHRAGLIMAAGEASGSGRPILASDGNASQRPPARPELYRVVATLLPEVATYSRLCPSLLALRRSD